MSNLYLIILLALVAGAMIPTQAAVNNKLAITIDSPILASFFSFLVGTTSLLIYLIVSGTPLSNLAAVKDASPLTWTGGLLGAFFVTATVLLVPRLGVAMTFSLVIAGQMLVTLVIDHFGLFGVDVRPISWLRALGILLITGGVILVRRF